MPDTGRGKRDSRGEWQPDPLPKPSPLFRRPWKPAGVLTYLFAPEGFLWPFNLFFALLAVVSWMFFTPSFARTARFEPGWIAEIYARRAVLLIVIAAGQHLLEHGQRVHHLDGVRGRDVVGLCAQADPVRRLARAPRVLRAHHDRGPFLAAVPFLLGPPADPLEAAVQPDPFRSPQESQRRAVVGLAMHPLEHLVYFSVVLIHWIVPSHPIHVIFNLQHAGLTPALGHAGFDKLVTQEERGLIEPRIIG